ncbi:MAG: chemotaxis protein CheW [Gemmatimonadales bacterium]|nr:chemotaxis protein CheW [Gemmatimonadales bacterium]
MSDATRARLLVFRVGTLVCAAEVDQVREILPRLPTTRIPGAPPVVAGLVNVRGRLVTVVEGWRALKQEAPATGEGVANSGSMLVLNLGQTTPGSAGGAGGGADQAQEQGDRLVGFTVDEVMDMLTVGTGAAETTVQERGGGDDGGDGGLPGLDPTLVRAVGRSHGALFVILDLAALLGPILLQGRGEQ